MKVSVSFQFLPSGQHGSQLLPPFRPPGDGIRLERLQAFRFDGGIYFLGGSPFFFSLQASRCRVQRDVDLQSLEERLPLSQDLLTVLENEMYK